VESQGKRTGQRGRGGETGQKDRAEGEERERVWGKKGGNEEKHSSSKEEDGSTLQCRNSPELASRERGEGL